MRRLQKRPLSVAFYHTVARRSRGHARYMFMDAYAGYNQIAIALEDMHKTTFTIPWGTFVWVVMPFRLCNTTAIFQRLVMYIFTNLLFKFMMVFVNDFSTGLVATII